MQTKVTLKKIIYISVIILFILLIYFWIKSCTRNIEAVYRYEEFSRGDVVKSISVTGKLEVHESHNVISKIGGVVKNVYADFNQKISRGQVLAVLDSVDVENKILKAERQHERAKLDMLEARRNLEGKNELLKEKLISQREMEVADLNFQKANSIYRQIKLDYDIALQERNYTRITSPVSGIVISRSVEPRGVYPANHVYFVIAENLARMRLMISVDESEIGSIKTGQKVTFTVSAYPERQFEGTINQVRINPIVQGVVVSYQSVVLCDNSEYLLKPGMTATAVIVVGHKKNVLRVPNQAFIISPVKLPEDPDKKYVWKKQLAIIKDLPVARVEVQTGLVGDQYTEITGGNLIEGDSILIGIQKHFEGKDKHSNYAK